MKYAFELTTRDKSDNRISLTEQQEKTFRKEVKSNLKPILDYIHGLEFDVNSATCLPSKLPLKLDVTYYKESGELNISFYTLFMREEKRDLPKFKKFLESLGFKVEYKQGGAGQWDDYMNTIFISTINYISFARKQKIENLTKEESNNMAKGKIRRGYWRTVKGEKKWVDGTYGNDPQHPNRAQETNSVTINQTITEMKNTNTKQQELPLAPAELTDLTDVGKSENGTTYAMYIEALSEFDELNSKLTELKKQVRDLEVKKLNYSEQIYDYEQYFDKAVYTKILIPLLKENKLFQCAMQHSDFGFSIAIQGEVNNRTVHIKKFEEDSVTVKYTKRKEDISGKQVHPEVELSYETVASHLINLKVHENELFLLYKDAKKDVKAEVDEKVSLAVEKPI